MSSGAFPAELLVLLLAQYLYFYGLTAGSILHLFLFVLLIAYRRRRSLEAWLALLFLAVFLYQVGFLLLLNLGAYYGTPQVPASVFAGYLIVLGLAAVPPLFLHAHIAYYRMLNQWRRPIWIWLLVLLAWAPLGTLPREFFPPLTQAFVRSLAAGGGPGQSVVPGVWAAFALLAGIVFQLHFLRVSRTRRDSVLHGSLAACFAVMFPVVVLVHVLPHWWVIVEYLQNSVVGVGRGHELIWNWLEAWGALLLISPIVPSLILGYHFVRYEFLNIGTQRSLIYAVSGGFLVVLYLTFVSRVSQWLEAFLPPVATISILVFALVFLYEPLQRFARAGLQRLLRSEVGKLQRVTAELADAARKGDLQSLLRLAEQRIAEAFSLAAARISLEPPDPPLTIQGGATHRFLLHRPGLLGISGPEQIGMLEVGTHGAILSGETHSALEAMAAQLSATIDLCRAIEEKLALERELAERQRMALLGQMAATISHNLKNPLSSIKTVMQVQLENPSLPESLRRDCSMVVEEIDRLAAKLQQLLQYARPAVRNGSGIRAARLDAAVVAARVVELLHNDAARRGITLRMDAGQDALPIAGPEDALHDVLQNLVVNALESVEPGGNVRVALAAADGRAFFTVSDDGPGISPDRRQKIFQPFYTTKPQGTGLGLAIVERRLAELKGSVECVSPLENGRGARFVVKIPLAGGH